MLWLSLSVALTAGCTSSAPPPRPQGLVAVRRIELGQDLFLAGEDRFAPGALERIERTLADVPAGSRLRVEVFAEGRGRSPHEPRGGAERLSRLRAEAMRDRLSRMGFAVIGAMGRGLAQVDGREADRRVDVFVLK